MHTWRPADMRSALRTTLAHATCGPLLGFALTLEGVER
jgi:uncharacterized membrane protein YccC